MNTEMTQCDSMLLFFKGNWRLAGAVFKLLPGNESGNCLNVPARGAAERRTEGLVV
jgi:hypothetical protein